MGIPVKYVQIDTHNINNILIDLNNTQKKWNVLDYVTYYAQIGNPDYIKLLHLSKLYKISVGAVCAIASESMQGGSDTDIIKAGKFKFKNCENIIVESKIERVLQACKMCGLKPSDKLIRVLVLISRHPQFKWKEFIQKVAYQRDKCYRCSTSAGYIKMFENIYNNKRRERIEFDEEQLRTKNDK